MKSFLKSIFLLSTAFFIVLFLSNCENNKTAVIQNKSVFKGHISGYTSGLISNSSTINIRLIDDVSEEVFSTPLEKNLFDFEPKIEGTTKWIDRRTIEFTPSDPLPSGTKYSANFKLGSLIDVDDDCVRCAPRDVLLAVVCRVCMFRYCSVSWADEL